MDMDEQLMQLADSQAVKAMMLRAKAIEDTNRLMMGYIETNQRINALYALSQLNALVEPSTFMDKDDDILELIFLTLMDKMPGLYAWPARDTPEANHNPPPEMLEIYHSLKGAILENARQAGQARFEIDPEFAGKVFEQIESDPVKYIRERLEMEHPDAAS